MRLQAQPPARMLHHASYGCSRVDTGTGLKKEMLGRQLLVNRYILTFVDHFHFVHAIHVQPSTWFGRTSHPVDSSRKRFCTVRLNADIFPCCVETVNKGIVYPERGFTTRENHGRSRVLVYFRQNLIIGHHPARFVLRIAETAREVATGEADKDGRCTSMIPLALQAIKDFVNLPHR